VSPLHDPLGYGRTPSAPLRTRLLGEAQAAKERAEGDRTLAHRANEAGEVSTAVAYEAQARIHANYSGLFALLAREAERGAYE